MRVTAKNVGGISSNSGGRLGESERLNGFLSTFSVFPASILRKSISDRWRPDIDLRRMLTGLESK